MTRIKYNKYKLDPGSTLLKAYAWKTLPRLELKSVMQRFATRENKHFKSSKPGGYLWRRRRLSAIAIYESRFGMPPKLFCQRTLPKLRSYYVSNGEYLWPSNAHANRS